MELIVNINLEEICARFTNKSLALDFMALFSADTTSIRTLEDLTFIIFTYGKNTDLKFYFKTLSDFLAQNPELPIIITGPNINHVRKHIAEYDLNPRLSDNTIDLIEILLKQFNHIDGHNTPLFYTKELIGPGSFSDNTLTDAKAPIKNYIDYVLPESYYILDVRAMCRLYKINNKKPELVISTKNGELPFHTSTLYLASKGQNPEDLQLDKIIKHGNNYNVDIRVRDIYGDQCNILPVDIIASSMGKIQHNSDFKDVLKSFIFVLVINISNIAGMIVR